MQGGNRFMDFLRNNSEAPRRYVCGPFVWAHRAGAIRHGGCRGFLKFAARPRKRQKKSARKTPRLNGCARTRRNMRTLLIRGVLSAGDAYKMKLQAQTPKQYEPMSTVGKINSDFKNGIIDQATRDALITKAAQSEGMEMVSDGQGGFTFRQGAGIGQSGGKMTESQAKANIFATRERGGQPAS
jgi:hypothetical protein